MKIKIQIISWITDAVLFEYESENNTIKQTLERAVGEEANLRGVDLRGANLQGADLQRTDLWGANLRGANLQGVNLQGTNLQGVKGLKMYWHLHHEILVENLTELLKNRIKYIKEEKSKSDTPEQIKLRLKLLKKVKCKPENYPNTKEDWEELHKKECSCKWDGKTIFT